MEVKVKKQTAWVAKYLEIRGSITQYEFKTLYSPAGDSSLSARISELRGYGWIIKKNGERFFLISSPIPAVN
jgi:hypothetical protein